MKRTSMLESTVDLNEDREHPGYIALHVDPTRIQLYLRPDDCNDTSIAIIEVSEKELRQIRFMIDQALNLILESKLNSYYVT